MGLGFGIAALCVAIVALVAPIVGLFVTWFALILTAVAAFLGDKALSIPAYVICWVNILFLSTLTLQWMFGRPVSHISRLFDDRVPVDPDLTFIAPTAIFFALPIVAWILSRKQTTT